MLVVTVSTIKWGNEEVAVVEAVKVNKGLDEPYIPCNDCDDANGEKEC